MQGSLFDVMRAGALTSLRLHYDWRQDRTMLVGASEWEADTAFAEYNRSFDITSPLSQCPKVLPNSGVRALFQAQGQLGYLEGVLDLMRKGRHCMMECLLFEKQNIRFVSNVHNDMLGRNNRRHAIRAGGIRRHALDELEYEVLIDGLNLSRGMSFKNAAAQIPYGGSKFTVMSDPVDLGDLEHIGCLSYGLDRARVFTGPDMGYPPELADVMNEHFTRNIVGGSNGSLGATGPPTAEGVFMASKEALKHRHGDLSLHARKVAVSGLGAVGMPLAKMYLEAGARIVVADIDDERVRQFCANAPGGAVEVQSPDEILSAHVDLFAPCAVGGLLHKESIPQLRCGVVFGAANNLLRASSQAQECALALQLQKHGVLYQVEWAHNMAGVICGAEEYEQQSKASMEVVQARARVACGEGTRLNLERAAAEGVTPTQAAYSAVERQIYGGEEIHSLSRP